MELQPINLALAHHRVGTVLRRRDRLKPPRQTRHPIAVTVPNFQTGRQLIQQRARPLSLQGAPAVLPPRSSRHLPAKLLHQKLHSVANSQQRYSQVKNLPIHLRRLWAVDTGRASTQNNSFGLKRHHLPSRNRMRNDFRKNGRLPDSSGNDLSILRPKIKDQHPLSPARGRKRSRSLQVDYFTDLAKIVKRDRPTCSQF